MSRQGMIGLGGGGWVTRLARPLGMVLAVGLGPAPVRAQVASPAANVPAPPATGAAPGPIAASEIVAEGGGPVLPPEIQVVRFQAPPRIRVEVLGPNPEPITLIAGQGPDTFGLKVGVGYQLRLSELPDRPGAELFPVVEVVGHLHRPNGRDPGRFPIRVVFSEADFADAVDRGRLVTQVVYLEDPEQALPIAMPKDEIPVVSLSPAEDPLKVAAALGRVMAIVHLGGRKPTPDERNDPNLTGAGLAETPLGPGCPFAGPDGGRCPLPCGPARGTPPPPGRPWVPRDEYLCDGGDRAEPAHFAGDGGLAGIDPRDAVIRFNDTRRPRILPTNVVCIYAPRFAEVRLSVGPNEALKVEAPWRARVVEREVTETAKLGPKRLVRNEGAEINRHHSRASGLIGRVFAGAYTELRVLNGYESVTHLAGRVQVDVPVVARNRQKPITEVESQPPLAIKTAEGPVVTGIIQGAGQTVMTWPARATVGVEVPPNQPGLAVIKRVSAGEAAPGEVLTFVIQFRNMGNMPIGSVSVIDSLLPRLGYIPGSAQGPKGTVFTAAENRVGSTELRWDLPGAIAPGAEGYVLFQAVAR
jgi:uncharacterized repeat protein (TIGR01451 family)